ncbi:MAG: zeta toxin family protein [Opitutaceae bacterium]
MQPSSIHVFAGVNGSGKSSILGGFIESQGGSYFNPDTYTRDLLAIDPSLTLAEAQSEAWNFGKDALQNACDTGSSFAFETTLGGNTIPKILLHAALNDTKISVYYIGLNSVELNIERVAARVARGGHDIPIEKIRQRWEGSILNIIQLLPHLNELLVYDNSKTVKVGAHPEPELLIKISEGTIHGGKNSLLREDFPEWAQPIAMEAINHSGV